MSAKLVKPVQRVCVLGFGFRPESVSKCNKISMAINSPPQSRYMTREQIISEYSSGNRDFRRITVKRPQHLGEIFLEGADLSEGYFRYISFSAARLKGVILFGATLERTSLTFAHLVEADLGGANLRSADLRWADLRGVNLENANLDLAYINGPAIDTLHTGEWEGKSHDQKIRHWRRRGGMYSPLYD